MRATAVPIRYRALSSSLGLLLFVATGCAARTANSGARGPAASTEGIANIDWSQPLSDGIPVGSVQDAVADLPFTPVDPSNLGQPDSIFVEGHVEPGFGTMAIVYDHPIYGPFWIIEKQTEETEDAFNEQIAQCQAVSCSPAPEPVTIQGGAQALLAEDSTIATRTLTWLDGPVTLVLQGPSATFTAQYAIAAANGI